MTELGIPVFNTPGANANAVKELVVCSLLLASRGILEGNAHVNNVINKEENVSAGSGERCVTGVLGVSGCGQRRQSPGAAVGLELTTLQAHMWEEGGRSNAWWQWWSISITVSNRCDRRHTRKVSLTASAHMCCRLVVRR